MSLFRRNIINVYRLIPDDSINSDNWESVGFDKATLIYSGLKADIQQKSTLKVVPAKLPGDVDHGELWQIFVNGGQNVLRDRDYIEDITTPALLNNGVNRIFQITSAYWTVFQYQCLCELLQT